MYNQWPSKWWQWTRSIPESLFIPDIPKVILMLHGEQGSAKSTCQELIRTLVDPSSTKTLTFPRDTNEMVQQLSHNYLAYFDNVSRIPRLRMELRYKYWY